MLDNNFGSVHRGNQGAVSKGSAIQVRRRPFWLPAAGFYGLTSAAAAGTFFLVLGILHDGREMPWVEAGIAAFVVLGSAVFLREIILRNARERYFRELGKLDHSLRPAFSSRSIPNDKAKLTLEQNAEMVRLIETKSEAARVLARFGEGHREVFDLCDDYLRVIDLEMPNVAPGSPRIGAFQRGKRKVKKLHHYHLMRLVEIESTALTTRAQKLKSNSQKIDAAEKAVDTVGFALAHYPDEKALIDSKAFLDSLVSSLLISSVIEKAERAEKRGDSQKALKLYREALERSDVSSDGEFADVNIADELRVNIVRLEEQTEDQ